MTLIMASKLVPVHLWWKSGTNIIFMMLQCFLKRGTTNRGPVLPSWPVCKPPQAGLQSRSRRRRSSAQGPGGWDV